MQDPPATRNLANHSWEFSGWPIKGQNEPNLVYSISFNRKATEDKIVTHPQVLKRSSFPPSSPLVFFSDALKGSNCHTFRLRLLSAFSVACREELLMSRALHLNPNKRPLKSPPWSPVTGWLRNNVSPLCSDLRPPEKCSPLTRWWREALARPN